MTFLFNVNAFQESNFNGALDRIQVIFHLGEWFPGRNIIISKCQLKESFWFLQYVPEQYEIMRFITKHQMLFRQTSINPEAVPNKAGLTCWTVQVLKHYSQFLTFITMALSWLAGLMICWSISLILVFGGINKILLHMLHSHHFSAVRQWTWRVITMLISSKWSKTVSDQ